MALCESCGEPVEVQSVVRGHNRTLRRIVSTLRKRVQNQREYQDNLFVELCTVSPSAEASLREICERTGIEYDPDDHSKLIEECVSALNDVRYEADADQEGSPERTPCTLPPYGWYCTRLAGHSGPCAAIPLKVFVPF